MKILKRKSFIIEKKEQIIWKKNDEISKNKDQFIDVFNKLAITNGFDGIYFVETIASDEILKNNSISRQFGVEVFQKMRCKKEFLFQDVRYLGWIERQIKVKLGFTSQIGKRLKPLIFDYNKAVFRFNLTFPNEKCIRCVFTNWDNSARNGKKTYGARCKI